MSSRINENEESKRPFEDLESPASEARSRQILAEVLREKEEWEKERLESAKKACEEEAKSIEVGTEEEFKNVVNTLGLTQISKEISTMGVEQAKKYNKKKIENLNAYLQEKIKEYNFEELNSLAQSLMNKNHEIFMRCANVLSAPQDQRYLLADQAGKLIDMVNQLFQSIKRLEAASPVAMPQRKISEVSAPIAMPLTVTQQIILYTKAEESSQEEKQSAPQVETPREQRPCLTIETEFDVISKEEKDGLLAFIKDPKSETPTPTPRCFDASNSRCFFPTPKSLADVPEPLPTTPRGRKKTTPKHRKNNTSTFLLLPEGINPLSRQNSQSPRRKASPSPDESPVGECAPKKRSLKQSSWHMFPPFAVPQEEQTPSEVKPSSDGQKRDRSNSCV